MTDVWDGRWEGGPSPLFLLGTSVLVHEVINLRRQIEVYGSPSRPLGRRHRNISA